MNDTNGRIFWKLVLSLKKIWRFYLRINVSELFCCYYFKYSEISALTASWLWSLNTIWYYRKTKFIGKVVTLKGNTFSVLKKNETLSFIIRSKKSFYHFLSKVLSNLLLKYISIALGFKMFLYQIVYKHKTITEMKYFRLIYASTFSIWERLLSFF